MLVVRESEKLPGLRYLTSVNEKGEECPENVLADFDQLMRERGMEPPPQDKTFGPAGKYDPEALRSFKRKKLAQAELKELAAELAKKYNPTRMSQEDFDSFMDDLVKEGILSKNELGVLGYHGFLVLGSFADGNVNANRLGGTTTLDMNNPNWSTYIQRYGYGSRTLQETNGNALDYARLTLLWSKDPQGGDQYVKRIETQNSAFREMERILEAMRRVHR